MDILDKLVDLAQLTGSADVQCLWADNDETLQCEGLVHIVTAGSGYLCIDGETSRVRSARAILYFSRAAWVMC